MLLRLSEMNKICYTAIFGDIDNLHEPKVITKGWKYVCFTDRTDIKSDVYDIIRVKGSDINKRALNRLCKMQEFNDYEVKVYHDGCFRVNCDLDELPDNFLVDHPFNSSAFEELNLCAVRNKISKSKRLELKKVLTNLNADKLEGVYCGGLFKFTKPNQKLFNEWYSYQRLCVRDQWILPYLLDKYKVKFDLLTWREALKSFVWEKHVN